VIDIDAIIADAIRGGCPELFDGIYSDFPELIVANIHDALDKVHFGIFHYDDLDGGIFHYDDLDGG
jgi:hypothetical protein